MALRWRLEWRSVVFASPIFLFYFLPLTLALYYAVPRRGRHLLLVLLSYGFYGWANPLFVFLMLGSTAIDYACGLWLARAHVGRVFPPDQTRTRTHKLAVAVSVVSNLTLLGFFKYFNFGVDAYNAAVVSAGLEAWRLDALLWITLPLGISFYTFQSMSYTIDVYRGRAAAVSNPIDFACYVSMFPQLVAGPIIRFQEVADQLQHRTLTIEKFARGVGFVCLGLAKKVLLANPCGQVADLAFDAGSVGLADAWVGAAAYAFQIYFDFSAYSDMAIGLGLMLGFVFPKNFDAPYRAGSITEFWQRWHLSLSTWLRDYLYIPLGGNRRGPRRTAINLMVVMFLGGLWHGAAWTFVIWGLLHGVLLAAERAKGKRSFYSAAPGPVRVAITFAIVCVTWVFFRCENLDHALSYAGSMFGLVGADGGAGLIGGMMYAPWFVVWLLVAAATTWGAPQVWDFTRRITPIKAVWVLALFWVSIGVLATQSYNPFIYFIF